MAVTSGSKEALHTIVRWGSAPSSKIGRPSQLVAVLGVKSLQRSEEMTELSENKALFHFSCAFRDSL
jgi:hypothetical protein